LAAVSALAGSVPPDFDILSLTEPETKPILKVSFFVKSPLPRIFTGKSGVKAPFLTLPLISPFSWRETSSTVSPSD